VKRERSSRAQGFELRGLQEIGHPLADGQPLCRKCGQPMERHLVERRVWVCVRRGCRYAFKVAWSEGYFGKES